MGIEYNDALQQSLEYFGGEELPARAFLDKYAMRDVNGVLLESTPDDMHWRIAREISRIEQGKFKKPLSTEEVYEYLKDFARIIPQGGPMAGIGNSNQFSTLSNCYVLDSPLDSYGGIHWTDQQLTQIAKRRGGTGTDVSNLRPAEAPTTNSARTSSGIIAFMERYSNSIREVGQNGRRGALMLTCNVHHPQISDFTECKEDKNKITGANISVRLTDEFLNAVKNDEEYEQRWPIKDNKPYISRKVSARKIWNKIIHHAWSRAEPGLLFWDKIIEESPADCYAAFGFETISTNPCSELPLSALDSCRLLVLNLFYYVRNPFTKDAYFDFKAFCADAKIAQRFMDDIIDLEIECIDRIINKINNDPEPDYIKQPELTLWLRIREACVNGRRTGTGITALGDTLAALGLKYGSEESITVSADIYKQLKLSCYRSSVEMAKELGPFPIFDEKLEKNCPFLLRIRSEDRELYEDMRKYGRRNIALLTTAPTGTTSMMAMLRKRLHQTSSGIEPAYSLIAYTRKKKINPSDKTARVDSVDANGDKWQHFDVCHPGLKYWMEVTGEEDSTLSPYFESCAHDIDWKQRVKLQAAVQKHIDHAISSTINLPANATEEQVSIIYQTAWESGCKGMTVYRDGCRDGVLVENDLHIKKVQAVKRPQILNCNVHHMTVSGKQYCAIVGYLNGNQNEPYEVFVVDNKKADISKSMEQGFIKKNKRGHYELQNLKGQMHVQNVRDYCNEEEEVVARLISTSLRHGVDIAFIVHQMEKTRGGLQTFAKAFTRTLKKYIPNGTQVSGEHCPECKSENIARQEGCVRCLQCGWTKCS